MFTISVIFGSCKKEKVDDDGIDTSVYYVRFKLNGTEIAFQYGDTYQHGFGANPTLGGDFYCARVTSGLYNVNSVFSDYESIDITTIRLCDYTLPIDEDSLFHALFDAAVYDYFVEGVNTDEDGIEISWSDGEGNFYSSSLGSQSGSNFKISEAQEIDPNPYSGDDQHEARGTFNCKVYSFTSGEELTISDGEFYIAFSHVL
ncbi:MAG: hypothetical protein H7Y00_03775 [Fimbriimonadaceae bacterium]|nr:hypothetical protein [Chitinophagales bacterium]